MYNHHPSYSFAKGLGLDVHFNAAIGSSLPGRTPFIALDTTVLAAMCFLFSCLLVASDVLFFFAEFRVKVLWEFCFYVNV